MELKAKDDEVKLGKALEKMQAADEPTFDVRIEEPEKDKSKLELENGLAWKMKKPDFSVESTFEGPVRLVDVRTERVSEATANAVLAQAGVAIGDPVTEETAKLIQRAALAMDEHFRVEFEKTLDGELIVTILAR